MIAGFVASALFATLFVWREARAPQPMLPLSLFRNRVFASASLVGLLVNVAIYGLIFVLSLYFQQVNGLSAFATGLAFVPMLGAVLPVNLIAPRVTERIGAPATIAWVLHSLPSDVWRSSGLSPIRATGRSACN